MMFVLFYTAHLLSYLIGCAYYYKQDRETYQSGIPYWNKVKIQKYDDKVWAVWNSAFKQSCKNLALSAVMIKFFSPQFQTKFVQWDDVLRAILYTILLDIYFYVIHRLLHTRTFYRFHKHHHTNTIIVAASGFDTSYTEHLLNFSSLSIPFMITGGSWLLYLTIIIVSSINATKSHSGYKQDEYHWIHHRYSNKNYGVGFHICDRIFDTHLD
jgi:sterol desaturase/sphingolipid hydroxylase (fatty acid hydroxylase superfamily)